MRGRALASSRPTATADVVVDGMAAVRDSAANIRRAAISAALVLCVALALSGCGGSAATSVVSAPGA
ncbi:MAG: hypothetical protein WA740_01860, partial [Candidatus Binataceae bacterium]